MGNIQEADTGTVDFEFYLRAERDGQGNGRIYTVTYTATDSSGNSSEGVCEVFVPHNKANNVAIFDGDNQPNIFKLFLFTETSLLYFVPFDIQSHIDINDMAYCVFPLILF